MAKKNRNRPAATETAEGPNPRQPCPCGSGKRYKACHGSGAGVFVKRPFEGMPAEADLVALRELVPSATIDVTVKGHEDTPVKIGSLLPGIVPAMHRDSGEVWVGMQVAHSYGDPSRELAAVLLAALEGEPGIYGLPTDPGAGPRLQDLITDDTLTVEVHTGFEWWLADTDEPLEDPTHDQPAHGEPGHVHGGPAEALAEANEMVNPTVRLTSVEAAYWTEMSPKEHLRWVMTEPEDDLLTALARLHAAGEDQIVPGSRFVGMFRAQGLLVPVWDLPMGTGAEALEEPAVAFKAKLDKALADTSDLTSEQRSARAGLANRQVTIR